MNTKNLKKTIGVTVGMVIMTVAIVAQAAVSYEQFTFDYPVRTTAGVEYSADLVTGSTALKKDDGRYDMEAILGFYGLTDMTADARFNRDIADTISIWYKKKGTAIYERKLEEYGTTTVPVTGISGHILVKVFRSSSNGYLVDPGTYTVDAVMNGATKIASYDICLPTFTSPSGRSVGNERCGAPEPSAESPGRDTLPTASSPTGNVTFSLSSVAAPATTLTVKGTLTASPTVTESFDEYVWPVGGTPQKIKTTSPAEITSTGFPLIMTVGSLQPNTGYFYRITAKSTGKVIKEGRFTTNVTADQAASGTGTDAVCGTAADAPQASKPIGEAQLCSVGRPGTVATTTTGWRWACSGISGGADEICETTSLSGSGASTTFCGTANGTTRSTVPSTTQELCSTGYPFGAVSITATGWSWKCQSGDTGSDVSQTCSATKGDANADGTDSGTDPKNFLQNPFKELDSFPKIAKAVVNNIVLPIAVPFIAVMIIYSGLLFVVARKNGNVDGYAKAKSTLMYTLIGAALVLGAFVIANALQSTIDSIVSFRQLPAVIRVIA